MPPRLSPGFPAGLAQGLSGCHTEKAPASSSCPSKTPRLPSLPPSPPPFLSASGSAGLCFRTAHLLLLSMYFRGRLSRPPQPSARDLTLSPSSIPTHTCSQTDSDMQSHTHRPLPTSPAGPAAAMVVWAGPRRGSGRGPHGISLCPYPWRHFLAQPKRRPRLGWSGILGFGGLAAAFSETVGQGISL